MSTTTAVPGLETRRDTPLQEIDGCAPVGRTVFEPCGLALNMMLYLKKKKPGSKRSTRVFVKNNQNIHAFFGFLTGRKSKCSEFTTIARIMTLFRTLPTVEKPICTGILLSINPLRSEILRARPVRV